MVLEERRELVGRVRDVAHTVFKERAQFVPGNVALTTDRVGAVHDRLQRCGVLGHAVHTLSAAFVAVVCRHLVNEELEGAIDEGVADRVHRVLTDRDQDVAVSSLDDAASLLVVGGVLSQKVVESLHFPGDLIDLRVGHDQAVGLVLADVEAAVASFDGDWVGHVRTEDPVRVVTHFNSVGVHLPDWHALFRDEVAQLGHHALLVL